MITTCSKGEDKQNAELDIELQCAVLPPKSREFTKINMLDLKKAQESIQGPMILPLRRMDVSSQPLFLTSKKEELINILGSMFTSDADRMCKMLQSITKETLYNLKETIQTILKWSIDPPEENPLVSKRRC